MIVKRIVTVLAATVSLVVVPAVGASAQELGTGILKPVYDLVPPLDDISKVCVQDDDNLDRQVCVPLSEVEALRFVVQGADAVTEENTGCSITEADYIALEC